MHRPVLRGLVVSNREGIDTAFAAMIRSAVQRAFVRPTDAIDIAVGEIMEAAESWREATNEPTSADACNGPCCGGQP